MASGQQSDRVRQTTLFGLFFLSGVAALIYQTAWHRLLGLFAGADTIAAALVVGAFLLGLGIGSLAAGLYADRLSRRAALIAFAICEVGIALFAVVSPWLYYDVIYRELLPLAESRAVIFAVVFVGLLWPTFLMGCSLPFLSKAIVSQIAGSAQLIGWLYGLNTLGAGVGAFFGGWYLIGTVGFDKAVYLGALINLVVAGGGLLLARGLDMAAERPAKKTAASEAADGIVWRWSLLVFISGFLIVALQIVWYRLIGVLLQSNGYSFSLVLTVFLLGDAAGLMVGARVIDRIADPRRFFFLMQGIATALALAGAWFVYLGIGAGILPATFVDRDIMGPNTANPALILLLLAVVVLPASFIMGFSFPVVQKAVQRDLDRLGSRVGFVQLANIVGNSMGSLVAGLLLLDLAGTAGTLKLLVAIGLAFAVLQLAGPRATRWAWLPAGVLAAGLLFFPGGEAFWRRLHGLTTEKAIVAEDKTGLSLLKMSGNDDGRLYIQGHSQSRLPFDTVHSYLGEELHGCRRQIGSRRAAVEQALRRYGRRRPPFAGARSGALRCDRGRRHPAQDRAVGPAEQPRILRAGESQTGTGRNLRAMGADRALGRDVPLGLSLRDHGASGDAGKRPAHSLQPREDRGAARPARRGDTPEGGADRRGRTGQLVRRQEDRGSERRGDGPCAFAQHGFLSARRILPQSSLMSRATSGRRSSAPILSASSKVRSISKRISGALRRPAFSLTRPRNHGAARRSAASSRSLSSPPSGMT